MAASAQVLRQLQGGWLECLDAQGVYYYNQLSQQTSEAMPPGAMAAQASTLQAAPALAPSAQPQQKAVTKMQIGAWTVAEDAQGEFYFNQQTGQSYDQAPPELLALIQQLQAAPQQGQVYSQPAQAVMQQQPQYAYGGVQYAVQAAPQYAAHQYVAPQYSAQTAGHYAAISPALQYAPAAVSTAMYQTSMPMQGGVFYQK